MAPRPPKAPRAPQGLRAPTAPRLRLGSLRSLDSTELDDAELKPRGAPAAAAPPYIRWSDFRQLLAERWDAGEHLAIVGQTGSGKTTLARQILPLRDYVVVFATKRRDDSIDALARQGYVVREKWSPDDVEHPRVIFKPPLAAPTREAQEVQQEAFRKALIGIFATGGWCLYLDEIRYLTETLRLRTELDTLWLQGRSLGITVVAATQRPVSVPLNMFEQSSHFFLFRTTGRDDRLRASEFTGANAPIVDQTIMRLPRYEALYVDSVDDFMARTTAPAR